MSSNAAFEIALLQAVAQLLCLELEAQTLARLAYLAEVKHAGVSCKIMDRMACSVGEAGAMLLLDKATFAKVCCPMPPVQKSL
jgi:galactokinase